ncbi:hypothetical protein U1872_09510 [Sphingomonas sp. RB3P16]|uniref:hypothetical protein n=1 Tax=Parasphingomonas frigoris TaxID=3096163 RepID=UPI002FCB363A
MTIAPIAGDLARSELAERIALIGRHAPAASLATLATEIDAIRAAALRSGLLPAVAVAQVIAAALARGERGTLLCDWIAMLREAVGCERQDEQACQSYAAACSVRLTG